MIRLCLALALAGAAAAPPPASAELELGTADPSVRGAIGALAGAIVARFREGRGEVAFHRVAIPYFEEVGDEVAAEHLGRIVAELLAVELSRAEPFVVVERERLQLLMKEHRLTGLGIVDESTAAQFGRVLGAQSLISGTVAATGTQYVVSVRQVEVESGRVLAAGQVGIDRAGLVALSSDAVELRSKAGALFRSALLPGWGQLYNHEPVKGWTFAAGGVAAAGAGFTCLGLAFAANAHYQQNTRESVPYRAEANRLLDAATALFIGYGILWAVNVVDAYLSGADGTTIDVSAALPAGGS